MEERAYIPRIRTSREALAEVKRLDPRTALKLHHIQRLMKSGKVQTVRSGNRIFVNLDSLIEYLGQNPVLDLSENKKIEGIRPVPEVIRR